MISKAYFKKYNQSPKGKARNSKYELSSKRKARNSEWRRIWRQTPKGKAWRRRQYKATPTRVNQLKRKAITKSRPGHFTTKEWTNLLQEVGRKSWLTGKILRSENLAADHIVPLSNSKSTNFIWNILPLSRKENSSKRDKDVFDWLLEKIKEGHKVPRPTIMRIIKFAYRKCFGELALRTKLRKLRAPCQHHKHKTESRWPMTPSKRAKKF
jgi:hypothetical protein